MRTIYTSALLLSIAVLLGCGNKELYKPVTFERQDQAGSTHVAVLSVDTWSRHVEALQPRFTLTADQAVGKVGTISSKGVDATLQGIKTGVALAPPTTSKTTTRTTKSSSASPDPETTSETKEEKKPGDTSKATVSGDPVGGRKAKESVTMPTGTVELDAMTKYKLASELYKEVQLLNTHVRSAALRKGLVPFVVRLQISLQPSARHEPYDAYTTFSFFSTDRDEDVLGVPVGLAPGERDGAAMFTKDEAGRRLTPEVVPLLVTDNLERALRSRAVNEVRQQAFALAFLVKGFAGNAEFQRLAERLEAVLGQDLNSILSLARVSQNTLRVRLGAVNEATAKLAMVTRTHDVSVLLLVPKKQVSRGVVHVVSKTTFVDARTGKALPEPGKTLADTRLRAILERHGEKVSDDLWRLGPVQFGTSDVLKLEGLAKDLDGIRGDFQAVQDSLAEVRDLKKRTPEQTRRWDDARENMRKLERRCVTALNERVRAAADPAAERRSLERKYASALRDSHYDVAGMRELLALVRRNRSRKFLRRVGPYAFASALWLDLVEVYVGGQYGALVLDLPRVPGPKIEEQVVFVRSEAGGSRTVFQLTGAGLGGTALTAKATIGGTLAVWSRTTTVSGDVVSFGFPNLFRRGLVPPPQGDRIANVELEVFREASRFDERSSLRKLSTIMLDRAPRDPSTLAAGWTVAIRAAQIANGKPFKLAVRRRSTEDPEGTVRTLVVDFPRAEIKSVPAGVARDPSGALRFSAPFEGEVTIQNMKVDATQSISVREEIRYTDLAGKQHLVEIEYRIQPVSVAAK